MPPNPLLRLLLLTSLCLPLAACGTKGDLYRSEEPTASIDVPLERLFLALPVARLARDPAVEAGTAVTVTGDSGHRRGWS